MRSCTPSANLLTGTEDTALFSAPLIGYSVVHNPDGSVTVSDAAGANVDGTDTLWNMERALFCTNLDANTGKCLASEALSLTDLPGAGLSATSLNFAARARSCRPIGRTGRDAEQHRLRPVEHHQLDHHRRSRSLVRQDDQLHHADRNRDLHVQRDIRSDCDR